MSEVPGALMIDIAGPMPDGAELGRLCDPRIGGVILFSRNYESPAQLRALVAVLRASRSQPLLVAVDHEGGRVQRFRSGFSALPAMAELGRAYVRAAPAACEAAYALGVVLAWELLECGLDFSFTPVLDLGTGASEIIGARAFAADPDAVIALAAALIAGIEEVGSSAIGKHFPGHGQVAADSHVELPIDPRSYAEIEASDLRPFRVLGPVLRGVMPAHVVYPACDSAPAGFSRYWLQGVLRQALGYQGAIFSDDLAMGGAVGTGTPAQRAQAAFLAGCDMVLLCNDPAAVELLLESLPDPQPPAGAAARLARLAARRMPRAAAAYGAALHKLDGAALEGWSAR